VTNVKTNTDTQKLEHIPTRMLKAELERRDNGRTYADVYERCGVSDEHRHLFDEVVYAICTEDMSITEVSTPDRAGFIHGNAKNWVRNAGNLRGFKELCGSHTPTNIGDEPDALSVCREYLQSRKDGGTGFTTRMFLEQIGTYKGKPFGVVVKEDNVGTRYVIGALRKDDPQAFKQSSPFYKQVDKATKGQRMKVDYLVFDPVG